MRHHSIVIASLFAVAGCGDDAPAESPEVTCPIGGRVKLAAPPEGWVVQEHGVYAFHLFGDLILYTFDDEDDPERMYWRIDRCTGVAAPFPSLKPKMFAPYVRDTPAGRVLYARTWGGEYLVDRLDVPGDDEPVALAGLPPKTSLFSISWSGADLPYAFFHRNDEIYTHAGDPNAPVHRVAGGVAWALAYADEIVVYTKEGEVRTVDPFTGASELVLAGVQVALALASEGAADRLPLIWQSAGDPRVYVRRIGSSDDVQLDLGPSTGLGQLAFAEPDGSLVYFGEYDSDSRKFRLTDVVRSDTGAAISVPAHLDARQVARGVMSLVLSESPELVAAIWEPQTGAVHDWYRGPGPLPRPDAYDGTSVYHYVAEPDSDPPFGSLWRADLATGERREAVPYVDPEARWIDPRTLLLRLKVGPSVGAVWADQLFDLKFADVQTGLYTPIADNVSQSALVPGEGVIYLDAHASEPGLWAVPLP